MSIFKTYRASLMGAVVGLMTAAPAILSASHAEAQSVGTAAASNTRSDGTPPGGQTRQLQIGTQVVRREKVTTSATGSVQVLFIDKTTLNVGPNSAIVIDDFVFNPATDTGSMAVTLGRGVLRVVGGQATHTGGGTVRTPAATIGIRGGVATISHDAQKGTRVVNHFGTITVASPVSGVQVIRRPGFAVTVAPPATAGSGSGGTSAAPTRVTQAEVDGANAVLTSKGGQTGGTTVTPSDQGATQAGVGTVNATVTPAVRSVQAQTTSESGTRTVTAVTTQSDASKVTQSAATQRTDSAVAAPVAQAPAVVVPPPVVLPTPTAYAMIITRSPTGNDPGVIANAPYLLGTFAASGNYNVSPVLGYRVGGANADGTPNTTSRVFQSSLNITGAGASQNATLSVMTGIVNNDNVFGYVQAGGFNAVSQSNTPGGTGVARALGAVGTSAAMQTDTSGLPINAFIVDSTSIFTNNTSNVHTRTASPAFTNSSVAGPNGASYSFSETQTRIANPAGLGAIRPDEDLTGYVAAVGRTRNFTGGNFNTSSSTSNPYVLTNATGSPGDIVIRLRSNSSQAGAQFNLVNATPGSNSTIATAQLNFGNIGTAANTNTARGTYVDDQNFALRAQFTGTSSGDQAETSSVNGTVLNTTSPVANARSSAIMVTGNSVNLPSFFPGVTFCQCDYTRWGLWSVDTFRTDVTLQNGWSDRPGIGTWVAGRAAQITDIPTIGTATYAGHVIASITGPGASNSYLAASNFSNSVNFATRVGTVAVGNLDGTTYGGSVTLNTTDPRRFATQTPLGAVGGTLGRTMTVNGSFFQGTASPIGEMGGQVQVNGANYLGAGTFAAKR
jgi:hypothetical protein